MEGGRWRGGRMEGGDKSPIMFGTATFIVNERDTNIAVTINKEGR